MRRIAICFSTNKQEMGIIMGFDFFNVISLLGGLALFLYGMNILGSGLEKISGGRMEKTLEKLTNNILLSVLLGAVVTAAIQSSSATTVIVVGLVNAGILKLRQAIGVIMGANIGTTVTAHILRLTDIGSDNFFLRMLNPKTLAPLVAIIGILLFMTAKRDSKKDIGQILLGFGILFTGMFNMEAAVAPLKNVPEFTSLFATFSNPVLGVIFGAVVTAVIQSSSASVGILQALSSTGSITYASAFPIIMGQNIGTCITPILASIGASKNAKRSAMVHLYFNIIGTTVFLIATYAIQYTIGFPFWETAIDKGGIANFHTIFNVVVTLGFIPFAGLLEKLANWTIRAGDDETNTDVTSNLDELFIRTSPGLAIDQARITVNNMASLAKQNYVNAVSVLDKYDAKAVERIREAENTIDKMEDRLGDYLLKISAMELTEPESRAVTKLLKLMSEFERIGDYSINIVEAAEHMFQNNVTFSAEGVREMKIITDATYEIVDMTHMATELHDTRKAINIEPLEEVIDLMEETLKTRHIDRMKAGLCTADAAFPFVEILGNLERISDHCSNVGVYLIGHEAENTGIDRHEYIRKIHKGETEHYSETFAHYESKYFSKIKTAE